MALKTRHWDRHQNGGLSFTELGFGLAPLGNLYRAISDEDADAILEQAWASGIRYFDTAPLYGFGLSETRLNRFLRGKPRDSYVISTKVGRLLRVTGPDKRDGFGRWFDVPARCEVFDYGYDGVMRSFEASLERLGLDRVDILFAHDLDAITHKGQAGLDAKMAEFLEGGYRALLSLREQGAISAIGAGLNEWQPCQWLAERADMDIFLLALSYTLLQHSALDSFLPLCMDRGIGIVVGGPYNSGILATGARPGANYNYEPAPADIMARVAKMEAVCARHSVRLVDAAFQFPLGHPAIVSVIPGGQRVEEVASNVAAAGAAIAPAFWAEMKAAGLIRPDAPTL